MSSEKNSHFIWCNHCKLPPRWQVGSHHHGDYDEIYVLVQGRVEVNIEDRVLTGAIGDVFFHPMKVPHSLRALGKEKLAFLHLRSQSNEARTAHWKRNPVFDAHGRIRYLINWMLELYPNNTVLDREMLDVLTQSVYCEISRLQKADQSLMIERVRRHIRTHFSEPISVDDMARAAHLSKYHFIRKFREQTGLTPKRFLNEIRLEAAEHLLLQSDMTNETIAQQVGFPDASYFSHVYRRHRGHPPGALRANRRDAAITP